MRADEMASRLYFEARLALLEYPGVRLYNRDPPAKTIRRGPRRGPMPTPRHFTATPTGLLELHADRGPDAPIVVALLSTQEVDDRGPDRIRERAATLHDVIAGAGRVPPPGSIEYRPRPETP